MSIFLTTKFDPALMKIGDCFLVLKKKTDTPEEWYVLEGDLLSPSEALARLVYYCGFESTEAHSYMQLLRIEREHKVQD